MTASQKKKKLLKRDKKYLKLIFKSFINYFKNRKQFRDIKSYCLFIGSGAGGSTLIGALLDAHPNIVIANELDALKYLRWGFRKNLLFSLILEKNKYFIEIKHKRGGGKGKYTYDIPNQWQGKFKKIYIIGNKKISKSTILINKNLKILDKLKKTVGVNIKFIHVTRNPYDVISTRVIRRHESIDYATKEYFSVMETVQKLKKQTPPLEIFDLKHEDLIANPKLHLKRLCQFLGVESDENYFSDCASIVYKIPHQSRYELEWSQELIKKVKEEIKKYDFLSGYSYK